MVGAAGFEPTTPSPPDWCANQAAPRSDFDLLGLTPQGVRKAADYSQRPPARQPRIFDCFNWLKPLAGRLQPAFQPLKFVQQLFKPFHVFRRKPVVVRTSCGCLD